MIKKIAAAQLRPGMYVHDLDCGWMRHPFLRNRFQIDGDKQINRILEAGIRELYIDTAQGLDAVQTPPAAPVRNPPDTVPDHNVAQTVETGTPCSDVDREFQRARRVHGEATQVVHNLLHDARLGKQVSVEQAEPVIEGIAESILHNPGPMLALCRIKTKDEYTFLHSVSVGALMMVFCRGAGMNEQTVLEAGLGGLLHDVGKMRTPEVILNKPGRLTDEEFATMRGHVVASREILEATPGITPNALAVAAQHHERFDGSGYAQKLKGDAISTLGQMAAIVDVYDAITSDRVYHKGIAPAAALKKLLEWSPAQFNPELVHTFVKVIGIYPSGTLVMMESGRLAVVLEQNGTNLLAPRVRIIYDTRRAQAVPPEDVDLSSSAGQPGADRIVRHEPPGKWSIDPLIHIG